MERKIAKELLKIKAVFLRPDDPFTWASGIQSPIYCDNRLTLSYPETRNHIIKALTTLVQTRFPDVQCIIGTATAGIPHAALVADRMNLPMGYVRSSSKSHGRNNQIEGHILPGTKLVVIEDLISTGGSSVQVVNTLREAGFIVEGVAAIFSYNLEKATSNFATINTPYYVITNFDILLDVALEMNYIKPNELTKLEKWKNDPTDSSWMV